jgi:hypothetical protein
MLAAWAMALTADQLAAGLVLSGPVLAVLHLAALGWLTMVAMGASCQLLPVALGAPLWSDRLARILFWMQVVGVSVLACGFVHMEPRLLVPGAAIVWSAVALFLLNVGMTLAHAPRWTMTAGYMGGAYASLGLVATLGLAMAADLATGFSAALLANGPPAHGSLAVFGWLLPLIVGVSYKLLPMFGLIHGHSERLAQRNGPVWALATVGLVTLLLAGSGWWPLALTVQAVTVLAFGWDVRRMLAKRMRKAPDIGLRFVAGGLVALGVTMIGALWPAWGGPLPVPAERVWLALGLIAFLGGLSPVVLGYLHRILPFLQWLRRYGDLAATGPLPRTQDLLDDRLSRRCFWPYQAGVALLVAAVLMGDATAVLVSSLLWAIPATLLGGNLLAVLRR